MVVKKTKMGVSVLSTGESIQKLNTEKPLAKVESQPVRSTESLPSLSSECENGKTGLSPAEKSMLFLLLGDRLNILADAGFDIVVDSRMDEGEWVTDISVFGVSHCERCGKFVVGDVCKCEKK